uniref:Uncharacterized protein n=1 Tax=Arundo donax TaxID=35708 RepID=A0A0A9F582_ARUDO
MQLLSSPNSCTVMFGWTKGILFLKNNFVLFCSNSLFQLLNLLFSISDKLNLIS